MTSSLMQYKTFQFPHNPHLIQIISSKKMQNTFSPILGDVVRFLGDKARVVRGEGAFFGDNRESQFKSLYTIFKEQTSGSLQLPGLSPFDAFFTDLTFIGEAGPRIIGYTFTFLEDTKKLDAEEDGGTI